MQINYEARISGPDVEEKKKKKGTAFAPSPSVSSPG
jgi:hypothetical protein